MNRKLYPDCTFHKIWATCIRHPYITAYFHFSAGKVPFKTKFLFTLLFSQLNEEQLYGRRILLFSYGSGLASSMYSMVCRKVHDSRFTLGQIQKSIRRARDILDHERVELAPELMDKLLSEREKTEHTGNEALLENENKL